MPQYEVQVERGKTIDETRIVLRINPRMTLREIAPIYSKARQEYLGQNKYQPLSEKHQALAVFYEETRGTATVRERMEQWNTRHPEWAYRHPSNFSRDASNAVRHGKIGRAKRRTQLNAPGALPDKEIEAIRTRVEEVPGSSLAETQKDVSRAFFDRTALLAEVDRLRDLLTRRRDAYSELRTEANTLVEERDKAEKEVERLQREHDALVLIGTGNAQMATGAYERLQRMQEENAAMRELLRKVVALQSHMEGTGVMRAPIYWNAEVAPLVDDARELLAERPATEPQPEPTEALPIGDDLGFKLKTCRVSVTADTPQGVCLFEQTYPADAPLDRVRGECLNTFGLHDEPRHHYVLRAADGQPVRLADAIYTLINHPAAPYAAFDGVFQMQLYRERKPDIYLHITDPSSGPS